MFHFLFFFFNDTATTEIYTLSLHDALPISRDPVRAGEPGQGDRAHCGTRDAHRSEEHTSELQSQSNLVCRLLLEKKKKKKSVTITAREQGGDQTTTARNVNQRRVVCDMQSI